MIYLPSLLPTSAPATVTTPQELARFFIPANRLAIGDMLIFTLGALQTIGTDTASQTLDYGLLLDGVVVNSTDTAAAALAANSPSFDSFNSVIFVGTDGYLWQVLDNSDLSMYLGNTYDTGIGTFAGDVGQMTGDTSALNAGFPAISVGKRPVLFVGPIEHVFSFNVSWSHINADNVSLVKYANLRWYQR